MNSEKNAGDAYKRAEKAVLYCAECRLAARFKDGLMQAANAFQKVCLFINNNV
jgi:hypothetical protein